MEGFTTTLEQFEESLILQEHSRSKHFGVEVNILGVRFYQREDIAIHSPLGSVAFTLRPIHRMQAAASRVSF